jgi:hypothetical protein
MLSIFLESTPMIWNSLQSINEKVSRWSKFYHANIHHAKRCNLQFMLDFWKVLQEENFELWPFKVMGVTVEEPNQHANYCNRLLKVLQGLRAFIGPLNRPSFWGEGNNLGRYKSILKTIGHYGASSWTISSILTGSILVMWHVLQVGVWWGKHKDFGPEARTQIAYTIIIATTC